MTIAITGAHGEFGRAVLENVARFAPHEKLVATVRNPADSTELTERGIEVRPGSFDEPEALRRSLQGVDVVFVNATFFGVAPELRGERVGNAIDAAADAGASRIVLTSWPDLEHTSVSVVQDYIGSEARLRAAGPAWTILRLGSGLADAVARDVMWARRDGELVAPAAGAISRPAAIRDLAEASGAVVAGAGHEGRLYELRGPDAVSWTDLAAIAGDLDGLRVQYRSVSETEYKEYLETQGLPGTVIDGLLQLYAAFRSGWAGSSDSTLAELLGRAPVSGVDAVRARVYSNVAAVPPGQN
jgi:NAD(P)H dehydrogenase (quinone)